MFVFRTHKGQSLGEYEACYEREYRVLGDGSGRVFLSMLAWLRLRFAEKWMWFRNLDPRAEE